MRRRNHLISRGSSLIVATILACAWLVPVTGERAAYAGGDFGTGEGPHAIVRDNGCLTNDLGPSDDGSSAAVSLPNSFNFDGKTFSSVYVNNNGSLTVDGASDEYDPGAITGSPPAVIAPLWTDLLTTHASSGTVHWGTIGYSGHQALCVVWDKVNTYSDSTSLLDDFQVLLVDRSDVAAGDFDVIFNYDEVQAVNTGQRQLQVGLSNGLGTSFALPGSGETGVLADGSGSSSVAPLVEGSMNAGGQLGRYVFPVHNVSPPDQHFTVPAAVGPPNDPNGYDTGYDVGSAVTLHASGTWHWQPGGGGVVDAGGLPITGDPLYLAPDAPEFSLVGRLGTSGPWTEIGVGPTTLNGSGHLYLAMNDGGTGNGYADNTGSLDVVVPALNVMSGYSPNPVPPGASVNWTGVVENDSDAVLPDMVAVASPGIATTGPPAWENVSQATSGACSSTRPHFCAIGAMEPGDHVEISATIPGSATLVAAQAGLATDRLVAGPGGLATVAGVPSQLDVTDDLRFDYSGPALVSTDSIFGFTDTATNTAFTTLHSVTVTGTIDKGSFVGDVGLCSTVNNEPPGTGGAVTCPTGDFAGGYAPAGSGEIDTTGVAAGQVIHYARSATSPDLPGGVSYTATTAIAVDEPPAVSVTAPADGATLLDSNSYGFTADASAGSGQTIDHVEFDIDGSAYDAVSGSGPYATTLSPSAFEGDGPHTLTAIAFDTDGLSTTSTTINVNVVAGLHFSYTGPTVVATGQPFSYSASVTNTSSTDSIGGIGAAATIDHGTFTSGGLCDVHDAQTLYCPEFGLGPGGTIASNATISTAGVPAGTTIHVTEGATWTGEPPGADVHLTTNVEVHDPPAVHITEPVDGATMPPSQDFMFAADAAPGTGASFVNDVEFDIDGEFIDQRFAGDEFSTTVPSFIWDEFGPGLHELTVIATDDDGLVTESDSVTVNVSSLRTAVVAPDVVQTGQPISFRGEVFNDDVEVDATGVTTTASIDRGTFGTAPAGCSRSLNLRTMQCPLADVAAGSSGFTPFMQILTTGVGTGQVVQISVTASSDTADSGPATADVAAHNLPSVAITQPANNSSISDALDLNVVAAAAPGSGSALSDVRFLVNDGAVFEGDVSAPGPYTDTVPALSAGTYTIKAIATDADGLTKTSATVTVHVVHPTGPPVVDAIGGPATLNNAGTFTATTHVGDTNATVKSVHWMIDGGLIDLGASTNGAAHFPIVVNPAVRTLSAGSHTIEAVATDSLGQTSADPPTSFNFTVPQATLTVSSTQTGSAPFEITPGGDAAWVVTVHNSSSVVAHHVVLSPAPVVNGVPVPLDNSAINKANHAPAGVNVCSGGVCSLGDLAAGAAPTFLLYADTAGFSGGTTVTGSETAAAANAGETAPDTLGNWELLSLDNGVIGNTAPNEPISIFDTVSEDHPQNASLILPASASASGHVSVANGMARPALIIGSATDAVRVTMQLVAASSDPVWCSSGDCTGTVLSVDGDFTGTSKTDPAMVVLTTRYVGSIPSGQVDFEGDDQVVHLDLGVCQRDSLGRYSTPCLAVPEYHRTDPSDPDAFIVYDIVLFSGGNGDPHMSRR